MDKSKWTYKKIGEIATFINGDRGINYPSQVDFVEDGIPFVNTGHLKNNKIDFSTMNYITQEKYDKLGSGKIQKGDILFCLRGSLGKKAIVEDIDKGAIASSLVIIRSSKMNSIYLSYYLESPSLKIEMLRNNNGSSQPNLSAKSVSQFVVPVPSLSEQQSIVSELDKINELISLKKAQLSDLDSLAQSIFYDMFGDPIENEKGWEVKKLGEVCSLKAGKSIKASELVEKTDNTYPCYGGNGIRGYIDRFSHEKDSPIIGRQGALCGNVNFAKSPFYATEHAVVVTPLIMLDVVWLYYILKGLRLEDYAHGVAQPGISVSDLTPISLPLPPLSLQQDFAKRIELIEQQKAQVNSAIKDLETLLASRMQYWFD